MKFRLPRKTKKKLEGKLWLYPADEKGNSLMANPKKRQKDYTALKKGIVRDSFSRTNRLERKKFHKKLDAEIYISDIVLKEYVENIFIKNYRAKSFEILIESKENPNAIKAYYNFINAYNLSLEDNSYRNICCLSVDLGKKLLKENK